MPSITTSPRISTAWAPRMCLCWLRMDLLCLSPAPSTMCQYLKGTVIYYCWFESRGLRRVKRLWSKCYCKRNLKRNLSFHKTPVTMQNLSITAQLWCISLTDLAQRSSLRALESSSTTSCPTSVGEPITSFPVIRSAWHLIYFHLTVMKYRLYVVFTMIDPYLTRTHSLAKYWWPIHTVCTQSYS